MMQILAWLPLVIALFLTGGIVWSIVTMLRSHLHPWQIGLRIVSAATGLAIISIMGVLPAEAWFVPWLLALAVLAAAAIAIRRTLTQQPPSDPTKTQAKLLARPNRWNIGGEWGLLLVLLGLAVVAG